VTSHMLTLAAGRVRPPRGTVFDRPGAPGRAGHIRHRPAIMTAAGLDCGTSSTVSTPRLEEQFQRSADQLAELTVRSRQPGRGGYDHDTLAALIASARQAVSDTAQALRRMAEGSYGTCERCTADIPLQRLEILPHARFCVPCQRRQTG